MSTRVTRSPAPQIYPKRYFDASPTWFQWNHLTAADVHALRTEPGFEGQQIYFHLNHPIQYVRLVGVVLEIDLRAEKYVLLSIDDGSGACIEIKTLLRQVADNDDTKYPSNTLLHNLDVQFSPEKLPSKVVKTICINNQPINIGTVIKAKGLLDSFRDTRQLKLKRIWIVKDTNEEAKAWSETARWKSDVLSNPWVLTQEQRDTIDAQNQKKALKAQMAAKKRKALDAKQSERHKQNMDKIERRRQREEKRYDAGALHGSNVVPMRVTDS